MAKLEGIEEYDLSRLRHAVSAGEPLNPEVIQRFRDAFGITIHDGYGQTETTLVLCNAPGDDIRLGSMGHPTPGHDVAVIDERGEEVDPGVEGDVAVFGRPPSLFAGYWRAPEETDAAFRGDWYVTGDRATRDPDGYFWFTGRADDVINSAAYRIGPFEVESALLEHPAVAESAVVGKPHAERGQIVKAFVVLRSGFSASDELAVELQEHCKRVTAPYKYPREIEFVQALPKTSSGKIRRVELREAELQKARDSGLVGARATHVLLPPLPPESDSGPEWTMETDADTWPESEPVSEPLAEAEPEQEAVPEPETEPALTFEPWPEPESAPEAPAPEPEAATEPEVQPEPQPESQGVPGPEDDAEPETGSEPQSDPADQSTLVSRLRAYERSPDHGAPSDPRFSLTPREKPEPDDDDDDDAA
jgi:hypothetical protein